MNRELNLMDVDLKKYFDRTVLEFTSQRSNFHHVSILDVDGDPYVEVAVHIPVSEGDLLDLDLWFHEAQNYIAAKGWQIGEIEPNVRESDFYGTRGRMVKAA